MSHWLRNFPIHIHIVKVFHGVHKVLHGVFWSHKSCNLYDPLIKSNTVRRTWLTMACWIKWLYVLYLFCSHTSVSFLRPWPAKWKPCILVTDLMSTFSLTCSAPHLCPQRWGFPSLYKRGLILRHISTQV